jgi:hypothetical protein
VKPNSYKVTANAVHGAVTGIGTYNAGSTVTLTAVPEEHYHFVNWTDSTGTVIGTNPTYTLYNLRADTTVTANFAIDMFTVTINAGKGGTVTGGTSGIYAYRTEFNLIATPNVGYKFVQWSDGYTSASRSFTVTDNASFSAVFKASCTAHISIDFDDFDIKNSAPNTATISADGSVNVNLLDRSITDGKYAKVTLTLTFDNVKPIAASGPFSSIYFSENTEHFVEVETSCSFDGGDTDENKDLWQKTMVNYTKAWWSSSSSSTFKYVFGVHSKATNLEDGHWIMTIPSGVIVVAGQPITAVEVI